MTEDQAKDSGRVLDSVFGLIPLPKKEPAPPKEKTAFPSRAMRDAPGQAPIIEYEVQR